MRIKESELILKKGRIYHLGLAPEELADIIITVGDPKRVAVVSKHFDRIEHKIQQREFLTHTGELGSKRISVIGTGIGPDNIDILLNEIDAARNIDFTERSIKTELGALTIVRMGTSGALQKDIPVDSIIASSHGFGLDGLMNFYDYETDDFQENFIIALKSFVPELFDICKPSIFAGDSFLRSILGKEMKSGITITAGGFYAPQGRELRLKQKMRPIIDKMIKFEYEGLRFTNFEMETSSIYGLAALLGHRALSVNAIIANRGAGTFSKDPYRTIENMVELILERIESTDI